MSVGACVCVHAYEEIYMQKSPCTPGPARNTKPLFRNSHLYDQRLDMLLQDVQFKVLGRVYGLGFMGVGPLNPKPIPKMVKR